MRLTEYIFNTYFERGHRLRSDESDCQPAQAQGEFCSRRASLTGPEGVTIEDPDSIDEQRLVTLGMDALGRLIVVVHTPRGNKTRLIAACKASKGESEQYDA